jgi:hypothetical protein
MILFEDIRSWWRQTKDIRAEQAILSNLPRAEIDTSRLGKEKSIRARSSEF